MLETLLAQWGYEVTSFGDGLQAYKALDSLPPPQIAILDWLMPGMDGLELCQKLRTSSRDGMYIILLTGRNEKNDLIRSLHAGADDYITKPFNPDELRARMRVGERILTLQQQRVEQETARYVKELEQAVVELRLSRSRLVRVQEEVRRAIAEELHGNVQTRMYMLYLRLQDALHRVPPSQEDLAAELREIAQDLDSLREKEIRQLSHRLHPSIIKLGLGAGLRSLRDQCERSITVDLDIGPEVVAMETVGKSAIPLNVRLGLYRVAEEALSNTIKHAQATRARVELGTSPDGSKLCLAVEDNGRGFVPDPTRRGLGLNAIADYMGAIGGSFEVISAPGQGTRITATVSLQAATGQDASSSPDAGAPLALQSLA